MNQILVHFESIAKSKGEWQEKDNILFLTY